MKRTRDGDIVLRPPSASTSGSAKSGGSAPAADTIEELKTVIHTILADYRNATRNRRLFSEALISWVLARGSEVLQSEPVVVPVPAPVQILGDIHGQLYDLVAVLSVAPPPAGRFLFLGDYVDRGKYGVECFTLLLGLKVLYPDKVWMLRGNHETDAICRQYGFFSECQQRYDVRLYKKFCTVFNCLPVAAIVADRALCMHGGLSPDLRSLEQLQALQRPYEVGESGLVCDLLWSDPSDEHQGWRPSERGVSFTFGNNVVERLLNALDLDLVVRAHQVMEKGYSFFAARRLVTVFSATNYCGEFTNYGAMLIMDEDLRCSFRIFKPDYGAAGPPPGMM